MIKKQINIIFAYLFAYLHSYFYKPKRIKFELCSLCQLDCEACWVRQNEQLIKDSCGGLGYAKFEDFKKIVDNNSFIKEIEVSNSGEIFLNPDFNKIIKYAFEKGIKLFAYTGVNLNYLTEETAENLVKYQFQNLVISIDGATPETYAIYRRKGDFNKVIENIKMIKKYKEKYNSNYPELTYKFIVFGHNEHEIEDAKKLAEELDIEIIFHSNVVKGYSPYKNIELVKRTTGMIDPKNNMISLYHRAAKDKKSWFYCKALFIEPFINYNGDLLGCSCLQKGYNINVLDKPILKALRDKKIIRAKAMLLDFNVKPSEEIPCSECYIYKELKMFDYNIKRLIIFSRTKYLKFILFHNKME